MVELIIPNLFCHFSFSAQLCSFSYKLQPLFFLLTSEKQQSVAHRSILTFILQLVRSGLLLLHFEWSGKKWLQQYNYKYTIKLHKNRKKKQSEKTLWLYTSNIVGKNKRICSSIHMCLCTFEICLSLFLTHFIPISPMNPPSLIPATQLLSLLVTDPH